MTAPILIVGFFLIGGLLVWPTVRDKLAKQDLEAQCASIRAQLAVKRTQGGGVDEALRLEAQLQECLRAMRAAGIPVDECGEHLAKIRQEINQINQEWAHYRSTSEHDPVMRNNTRQTILRLGETLVGSLNRAIDTSEADQECLAQIRKLTHEALQESNARYNCFKNDLAGCGRFALNEDHGNDKAAAEKSRVGDGLQRVRSRILELLSERGEASPHLEHATATGGAQGRVRP